MQRSRRAWSPARPGHDGASGLDARRPKPDSMAVAHARVVFALIMREMNTRYGRSTGGYLWSLLEPMGVIVLMSVVFSQIAHVPPLGTSFPLFYATGYMAFHFYFDISSTVSSAIRFNRPLLTFPRVTLIDAIIARFLLQFVTASFVTCVLLGGFVIYAHDQVRLDPQPILLSMALASLLGLGMASINCTLFIYSETWQRLFGIINRPMMLISGVFFLFEDLPKAAQDVLWWNPLVHLTALMRAGFYPVYEPNFVSATYLLFIALVLLMFGVLLLRILRSDILER